MREIKFRGRREFSDEYIFGYYACHHYPTLGDFHFIVDEHGTQTSVDPETVAQLIGHDSQGREVYEGDTLTDDHGKTYIAKFDSVVEWQGDRTDSMLCRMPIEFAKKFTELTLVEATA